MSANNIRWSPGIGDPSLIGWVTFGLYFIVALICLKSALVSSTEKHSTTLYSAKPLKTFWLVLTFLLIFLGINKQLDLQTLLTQIGRNISLYQGWYEYRRPVQFIFILTIGLLGVTTLAFLIKTYRDTCSSIKIALTGCVILYVFIIIRASSFHHMDIFSDFKFITIKINSLLEIGGIVIIGVGGYKYAKQN